MALDKSDIVQTAVEVPAIDAAEITPADAELARVTRAIYVGTAGDLAVVMAGLGIGATTAITFKNVPAGSILPIRCTRINTTNTTAADIVALY